MTAATVEATTLADELALETPTARKAATYLATIVDTGVRRTLASRLVEQRRAELALAVTLTRERFGRAPRLVDVERRDRVLVELTVLAIA